MARVAETAKLQVRRWSSEFFSNLDSLFCDIAAASLGAVRNLKPIQAKRKLQEEEDLVELLKLEFEDRRQSAMRQVQEMGLEFANALNAAAAAESECAKLRRMLEEERKLVQRLKQEKEDEAQTAKRKIEKISQRLAEARKDVEYATTRADVAEDEWIKVKRELQEEQELVQLLKPESEETRQGAMRQVEEKQLELANALNAGAIAESECDKLRIMLEEERKLVQRLELEKDDEAQLAKRQIEEIGQELADARKNVEYATTRADVAENEWIKAKRELQEERELVQLLKPEYDEIRQSAVRQVEEKELELVNALNACAIAERECAKLKRMLEEEQKLVQRLKLEKDDEAQLAKEQIEEISQKLAKARRDAELARKDFDVAENEWIKVKRELKEKVELVKLLELECQGIRQSAMRQDEEKGLELAYALNASAIAESECAKLKRMLEQEQKLVESLKLEKEDEAQLAERQIEEIGQELAHAQKGAKLAQKDAELAREDADSATNEWIKVNKELKEKEGLVKLLELEREKVSQELANTQKDAEYAREDAESAENEWIKVKRELKEKEELVKSLELEYVEVRQSAMRQVEEQGLELANALNASAFAESECAKLKRMLEEEQKLVESLKLEKDDDAQLAERQIEEIGQELAHAQKDAKLARKDAELAREDADSAMNEWIKAKRELKEEQELVKLLELDREEISKELANAQKDAEYALKDAEIVENELIKVKKELQEKLELVQLLEQGCESAMRLVEEKEVELANALSAAAMAASNSAAAAEECAICLTNEKDMAFGCGHMTCKDCGVNLSMCPICRKKITHRIKLFPG